MNVTLDNVIPKMMKKGMEKNNFVLTEVQNVLIQMCLFSSEHKILPYLFNYHQNKNKEIKLSVILCF